MKQSIIERSILTNLERNFEGTAPVNALWGETQLDTGCSYSGFKAALQALEEVGEVVTVEGRDRKRAKITVKGRLRLLEA